MSGYYLKFLFRPCVRLPIFIHCAVRFMQKNWDKLRKWVNTGSMWEAAQFLAGWWVLSPSKVWFVALKSIKKHENYVFIEKKQLRCQPQTVKYLFLRRLFSFPPMWQACTSACSRRERWLCGLCDTISRNRGLSDARTYNKQTTDMYKVFLSHTHALTRALIDPIFLSVAFYWCDLISLKYPQKPGSW